MPLPTVSEIEEASLKSWPALDTEVDGRWLLRAAGGYTRRSNSVQCLDPADDSEVATRLERAVRWYRDRRLPPTFRITPLTSPGIMAAVRDWADDGHSRVMALTFGSASFESDVNVALVPPTSSDWLGVQQELRGYDDDTLARLRHVVERIKVPARGLTIYTGNGVPAASAVMMVANGILYTGNVITAREHRRRGHARRLLETGMNWARQAGARRAALNVEADNDAAIRLYEALGYVPHYEYHYRSLNR